MISFLSEPYQKHIILHQKNYDFCLAMVWAHAKPPAGQQGVRGEGFEESSVPFPKALVLLGSLADGVDDGAIALPLAALGGPRCFSCWVQLIAELPLSCGGQCGLMASAVERRSRPLMWEAGC